MRIPVPTKPELSTENTKLRTENTRLRTELQEVQESLRAIREDAVDAFVVETAQGPQVFMLQGLDVESSRLRDEILAKVTDAVVIYGDDQRVIYLNAAAANRYGVSASDALGGFVDGIFQVRWNHPDDARNRAAALRDRGTWRGECLHVTRAGKAIPVEVAVSQLHRGADRPSEWLAVIHDVSERIAAAAMRTKLEAQSRDLQRWEAIGALAGRVADDVSAIHGAGTAVEMGPTELEAVRHRAHELRQRLGALNEIRASSRPFVSVATIVQEVARLLRAELPEEITIESSCATTTPLIRADAIQLTRALLNLGTNACHAMEDRPGTLNIRAAGILVTETMARAEPSLRSGQFVRIVVSDTGSGMDVATRQRAFEPFFTTKPPEKGAGLGLTVVQRIAQGHQGIIVVHSAPDAGSSFELYLPCTS